MAFAQIMMAVLAPDSVTSGKMTMLAAKKTAAARIYVVLEVFFFMVQIYELRAVLYNVFFFYSKPASPMFCLRIYSAFFTMHSFLQKLRAYVFTSG